MFECIEVKQGSWGRIVVIDCLRWVKCDWGYIYWSVEERIRSVTHRYWGVESKRELYLNLWEAAWLRIQLVLKREIKD